MGNRPSGHVESNQLGITKKRFPIGKLDHDFFHSSPQSLFATGVDEISGNGNPARSNRDWMDSRFGGLLKYTVSCVSPLSQTPVAPSSASSPMTLSLRESG